MVLHASDRGPCIPRDAPKMHLAWHRKQCHTAAMFTLVTRWLPRSIGSETREQMSGAESEGVRILVATKNPRVGSADLFRHVELSVVRPGEIQCESDDRNVEMWSVRERETGERLIRQGDALSDPRVTSPRSARHLRVGHCVKKTDGASLSLCLPLLLCLLSARMYLTGNTVYQDCRLSCLAQIRRHYKGRAPRCTMDY